MKSIKKVLIIEDEAINAQRLQRLLSSIRPQFEVLSVLESIAQSVEWLSQHPAPNLILMDIRLADGVSFEIFNLIDVKSPVIFTTAYDEYAVKAFKYNSIDYLLKPIDSEELEAAIHKFEEKENVPSDQNALIKNLMEYIDKKEYRTRFLLPFKDGFIRLHITEIAFICSELGGTFAITFEGKKHPLSDTLEALEQQLDPKYFFRANRQYILHINAIDKVHNYFNSKLKLEVKHCKEGVVVSRMKASAIKEWLDY